MLFNAMASPAAPPPIVAVLFYIPLVLLTNYILLALFMGTLLENFQKEFATESDRTKPHLNIFSATMTALAKFKFLHVAERLRAKHTEPQRPRSFGIFSDKSWIRRHCDVLAKSERFDHYVLGAIIVSSLLLAVEHPNDVEGSVKATVLQIADYLLTTFFTAEMLIKMISAGVVVGHRAYLRFGFNVLDFIVVLISVSSLFRVLPKFFRVLRTMRVLRSIQHLKRWPNLQVVVSSLVFSLPSIVTLCGDTSSLPSTVLCAGLSEALPFTVLCAGLSKALLHFTAFP